MNATKTTKAKKRFAEVEAVLVHVGMPLLVLLKKKSGLGASYYIASAIPDDEGDLDFYLAVSVSNSSLRAYFHQHCDLRYLFAFTPLRKYYRVDGSLVKGGKVQILDYAEAITERLFPAPKFFSNAHTSDYGLEALNGTSQIIGIDGEWQMREFGTFHQKYSDLYAFDAAIAVTQSTNASTANKDRIEKAFKSKPFRGGSSYVGFFNDLIEQIPYRERPALEGIEYHSPGHVELRGNMALFNGLKDKITDFIENLEEITKAHEDIRSYLSKSGLLVVSGRTPQMTTDITLHLATVVPQLYTKMGFDFEAVMNLTERNLLIVAKIALALFRRLASAATFFAQGRLEFE